MIYSIIIITILIVCIAILANIIKSKQEELDNCKEEKEGEKKRYKAEIEKKQKEISKLYQKTAKSYQDRTIKLLFPEYDTDQILISLDDLFDAKAFETIFTKRLDEVSVCRRLLEELKSETYIMYYRVITNIIRDKILADEYAKIVQPNEIIPIVATLKADVDLLPLKLRELSLNWGADKQRLKKVESIRELREETQNSLEKLYQNKYQLQYLLQLYPTLNTVLDMEYEDIEQNFAVKSAVDEENEERDSVRDYVTEKEYQSMSSTERNQLALDRYIERHNKSKWQIGRDYELYVGYTYEQKGYDVDYTGSQLRLNDMGRDLIVKKQNKTTIIQCKYWGADKVIHEKHIMQLYGSLVEYKIENDDNKATAKLITSTKLSDVAIKFANALKIEYEQDFPMKEFPRIKCNIGKDPSGNTTKIYHLPMDLNYDDVKLNKKGEFLAMTVKEAESKGFRRAYKWHGNE